VSASAVVPSAFLVPVVAGLPVGALTPGLGLVSGAAGGGGLKGAQAFKVTAKASGAACQRFIVVRLFLISCLEYKTLRKSRTQWEKGSFSMAWLVFEALLALAIIVFIMVWTLKTRTDTPLSSDEQPKPDEIAESGHAQAKEGEDSR
jgi:L-asparagine transporter-like permease